MSTDIRGDCLCACAIVTATSNLHVLNRLDPSSSSCSHVGLLTAAEAVQAQEEYVQLCNEQLPG
jgi:hypothetical protein